MNELVIAWLGALTVMNVLAVVGLLALGRQVGLIYTRIPPP